MGPDGQNKTMMSNKKTKKMNFKNKCQTNIFQKTIFQKIFFIFLFFTFYLIFFAFKILKIVQNGTIKIRR